MSLAVLSRLPDNVEDRFFPLQGGLDLVTPAISKKPGTCIAGVNYEPIEKGYQRIDGMDRYSGKPEPYAQSYWVLNYDAGTAEITTGQTVTGATSGATGILVVAQVVSTGSFAGSDAAGYLILSQVSGTFQDNENLQVSAATKCVANGTASRRGATNDTNDDTWLQAAIEYARDQISAPSGSGDTRGVWVYNGTAYCFRNNAGGTAGQMFKATTSGWTAQSLGSRVKFQTGTAEITAGQTVTGASSGASGVVTRVALRTGSWAAGTAAGQLIFATITGTFSNGENLQVSAATKAVANGASAAITLPAGGTYKFVNHNFFGASDLRRMYGCNGQGTGFEWDGTVFVPIETGMSTDTPDNVAVHMNHLFFSFPGGSLQNSSLGLPYEWSPVTGASEIGIGDDVTNLVQDYAQSLIVFARNKVAQLIGTGTSSFQLVPIADEAGAIALTAQKIGRPIYMDDQGLRALDTTAAYGDFRLGTLSNLIAPLLRAKKAAGTTPVASLRCRAKGQYRLFWSDGTGLTMFLGRKTPEIMPFDLDVTVSCACSSEEADGDEIMLIGTSTGMVYRLDVGNGLDGEAVTAFARLAFNHCGSPYLEKVWRRAVLEMDVEAGVEIGLTAEFDYGDPDRVPAQNQAFDVSGGGGFWDEESLVWDDFVWDAAAHGKARGRLDGKGANVSIAFASSESTTAPHAVHGLTLSFSRRGRKKR